MPIATRTATGSWTPNRIDYDPPQIDSMGNDRYGSEIIAEKVDFLSRPKSAEFDSPELVDRDDETPF